jgi:hypothetical protein
MGFLASLALRSDLAFTLWDKLTKDTRGLAFTVDIQYLVCSRNERTRQREEPFVGIVSWLSSKSRAKLLPSVNSSLVSHCLCITSMAHTSRGARSLQDLTQ